MLNAQSLPRALRHVIDLFQSFEESVRPRITHCIYQTNVVRGDVLRLCSEIYEAVGKVMENGELIAAGLRCKPVALNSHWRLGDARLPPLVAYKLTQDSLKLQNNTIALYNNTKRWRIPQPPLPAQREYVRDGAYYSRTVTFDNQRCDIGSILTRF
jgi:hypothetical protein